MLYVLHICKFSQFFHFTVLRIFITDYAFEKFKRVKKYILGVKNKTGMDIVREVGGQKKKKNRSKHENEFSTPPLCTQQALGINRLCITKKFLDNP